MNKILASIGCLIGAPLVVTAVIYLFNGYFWYVSSILKLSTDASSGTSDAGIGAMVITALSVFGLLGVLAHWCDEKAREN